jgi:hypothetical protein
VLTVEVPLIAIRKAEILRSSRFFIVVSDFSRGEGGARYHYVGPPRPGNQCRDVYRYLIRKDGASQSEKLWNPAIKSCKHFRKHGRKGKGSKAEMYGKVIKEINETRSQTLWNEDLEIKRCTMYSKYRREGQGIKVKKVRNADWNEYIIRCD